jgi:ammonium transporter, Amt family
VGVQAIGVVATVAWCAILSYALLKLVGALVGLRVSDESETQGLDLSEHDERGYSL